MSSDNDGYRYFLKRAITSPPTFSFVSARLNQQATAFTKFKYDSTFDLTLKAISKDYSCAILLDSTSSPKKLLVVDFTADDTLKEDLVASTLVTEADIATTTL